MTSACSWLRPLVGSFVRTVLTDGGWLVGAKLLKITRWTLCADDLVVVVVSYATLLI